MVSYRRLLDPLAEYPRQPGHVAVQIIFVDYPFTPGTSEFAAQFRIINQAFERVKQTVLIRRRHQNSVDAITNQLGDTSNKRRNTRDTHRHSFHQGNRNAFSEAWQSEDVGLVEELANPVLVNHTFEHHVFAESTPGYFSFQTF